jgi:Zn-dependent protease
MFTRAVRIARIRGIDVRLDPSLVLLALLFAWAFGGRFTATYPTVTAWTMAAAGVLLVFLSILAHELAHALEALHRDIEVEGITLLMFGGVTEMNTYTETPRDDFVIAAVGPYVSLLCGAVFGLTATFAPDLFGAAAPPVAEVAGVLAWLNVILAVFNLLPAAPLDGGRVLRAGVWWVTKDRGRGVRVAARAGQLLSLGLIGLGVWLLVAGEVAATISAVVWLIIGFFLWSASRAELRRDEVDRLLDRHRVIDLVGEPPDPIEVDRRLDLVDVDAALTGAQLIPVTDAGRLIGVLPVRELEALHATDRSVRTAGELMHRIDDYPAVDLGASLRALVAAFAGPANVVRLERDGHGVGAVTEPEVARALHALRASGRGRAGRAAPPPPAPDGAGR